MDLRVTSVYVVLFTALAASSASSVEKAKTGFIAATTDRIGFSEGGEFYGIGINAEDFIKRFGPPQDRTSAALHYYDEGLTVLLDAEAKAAGYEFSFRDGRTPDGRIIRHAVVETDRGVDRDSAFRSIVKAYGQPDADVVRDKTRLLVWCPLNC